MISNGRSDVIKFLPAVVFLVLTLLLWPFVVKYVWYPILADALDREIDGVKEGYNIFNTIYLSALFIYLAYLLYEYLRYLKVDFGRLFPLAVVIGLLGGTLRALEDAGTFPYPYNILFITPFIYLLITFYVVVFLYFDREVKYSPKVTAAILLFCLLFLKPVSATVVMKISAIFVVATLLCFFAAKLLNFGTDGFLVLAAHMLDASATFVGLSIGYVEKHVVPRFVTSLIGPAAIFLLKFAVLVPLLYLLREKDDLNRFVKILILLLGLGPGFRNALRIAMGL